LLRVAPLELPQQSGLLFYFASTLETAASLCVVFMRAVRAGLELVAVVGALKTHAPLQTRVGIATGLVVVGDLIGSGPSQEQAIVGQTLRQQPVEALGAWTARGLFLWRSMARPRVLRGVILGLPFCSAMIGYSVRSAFSS
jgi:hypothetical protein